MNAFDFIVTVALGSTLATILLSKDVSWTEGATALALLVGLQFVVAWASTKSRIFRRSVTSRPLILLLHGEVIPAALQKSRLTESQLMQAIRSGGYGDVSMVGAVILEPNGKLSVIGQSSLGSGSSLPSADRR